MKIEFMRVAGVRTKVPVVIAIADGVLVKWKPTGWSCKCNTWENGQDGDTCDHVESVAGLLHDKVLGDQA